MIKKIDLGNVMGAAGKSAYQAAVEAGYAGSEAEFNAAAANTPGHIASRENPHGVTAAQVGALASTGGMITGELDCRADPGLRTRCIEGSRQNGWDGALYLNYREAGSPVYVNGANQVIHTGNIGGQSVNYANTAGNANAVGGRAAGTVLSEIDNLKTSVANGKALIASAISDKGVSTGAGADFGTMANNIRAIDTGMKYVRLTPTIGYQGRLTFTASQIFGANRPIFMVVLVVNPGGNTYRINGVMIDGAEVEMYNGSKYLYPTFDSGCTADTIKIQTENGGAFTMHVFSK